nr:MAG TPA: hypothetical protein [Caudoviricetes sp.]
MTAHKHAALMLQYAQDATESVTPWEMWEVRIAANVQPNAVFEMLHSHPTWDTSNEYRRKPQVIRVGRHEFPKPITTLPEQGFSYWAVEFSSTGFTAKRYAWDNCPFDLNYLETGLCHLTREAAEAHAKVLRAICKGDV